jgi:putative ABC transport system permease protein
MHQRTHSIWDWAGICAEQVIQDARYALRTLRRTPTLTAAVIVTLAIAIGMNTAIFSVFNAVVLRPIGYPSPERLVWIATTGSDAEPGMVTGPDFVDWREQATSFDRMVAYGNADVTVVTARGAARARAAMVTHDFWNIAGAMPAAGRLPLAGERGVMLLSHTFARELFGADADVIGRTVTLDGRQAAIVGVLPQRFRFELPGSVSPGFRPKDVDVYRPMVVSPGGRRQVELLNVVGRLKAGATLPVARAEIEAIRTRTAHALPNPLEDHRTLRVVPLHEQLLGGASRALLVLLGAVGFVLLIACSNVAHLLLARGSVRQREIAVRMSVGAGRMRLVRQLLVENLTLAAIGSAAGLGLAAASLALLLRIDAHAVPRLAQTTIDARVLVVVVATTLLTALAFGLAPMIAVWKMDACDVVSGGKGTMLPATGTRGRWVLVAGEIALALMLLIAAGLMLKSAARLYAYPAGFDPDRVLAAKIEFTGAQYSQPQRQLAFVDALLDRLRAVPGVTAATISTHGYMLSPALDVEGEPASPPEELARKAPIVINATSAALKQVMGFRVVQGRWFKDGEAAAVLNEGLAHRDLPGRDPIGRRIRISENGPLLQIVGVVANMQYSQLDAPASPEVYVPYARLTDGLFGVTALIKTTNDPLAIAPSLRNAVSEIDRTQVPDDVMTLERALAESIAPRRLNLSLLATFAAAAVVMALIGSYGVMAYSVTQRVQEIAIRIALGAQPTDVVSLVMRQGLRAAVAGIVFGLIGAFALTRFMENLLYEVRPTDPLTFGVLTTALAMTGLAACGIPALRAARVDPAITLRAE